MFVFSRLPLLLFGIALLAAGCDSSAFTSLDLIDADTDPVPLPGTAWTLTGFVEGDEVTDPGVSEITLSFNGEELSAHGSSSYNGYSGSYLTPNAGDSVRELAIYKVFSTRAGEPDGSRFEEYLQLLEQIDGYGSDGKTLVLTIAGKPVLTFEAR